MKKVANKVLFTLKYILIISGFISMVMVIIAFTTLPFWGIYNLSITKGYNTNSCNTIILLSGEGIPSESGLTRVYIAAHLAQKMPTARVVLSMPGEPSDSAGSVFLTVQELQLHGVQANRISLENQGLNTWQQAQNLFGKKDNLLITEPIIVVTSPVQIRRSVLALRKSGFNQVSGMAAWEASLDADLAFSEKQQDKKTGIPAIGNHLQWRYQFWNHLKYEIVLLREYTALAYYRLRGWN